MPDTRPQLPRDFIPGLLPSTRAVLASACGLAEPVASACDPMIDDALSKHYDELAERDYNRSKAGLGSAAEVEQSRPAPMGGHSEGGGGDGRAVALHYNSLADRHRTLSSGSDILHLRNLNNWIKSVLIKEHMQRGHGVLDLACGKGGDLNKFKIGGVEHYVGIDIAGQSVRDAVHRFNGSDRHPPMKFAATFCVGDFCQVDLEATLPRELRFHLVSCQVRLRRRVRLRLRRRRRLRLRLRRRRRLRLRLRRRRRRRRRVRASSTSSRASSRCTTPSRARRARCACCVTSRAGCSRAASSWAPPPTPTSSSAGCTP